MKHKSSPHGRGTASPFAANSWGRAPLAATPSADTNPTHVTSEAKTFWGREGGGLRPFATSPSDNANVVGDDSQELADRKDNDHYVPGLCATAPTSPRSGPRAAAPPPTRKGLAASPLGGVHFVGIGGCGMSSLAETLLSRGVAVQGSDLRLSERTRQLREQGAVVHEGHCADHVTGASLVVVSAAIPPDNVEVRAARASKIPVVTRGEMLATVMNSCRAVAVTGSHGKSTTTGLIGTVLRHAGLNPLVILGGALKGFAPTPPDEMDMTGDGPQDVTSIRCPPDQERESEALDQNIRSRSNDLSSQYRPFDLDPRFRGDDKKKRGDDKVGDHNETGLRAASLPSAQNVLASKPPLGGVVEADESDGSFLHLRPEMVVLTHVDREHVDYWHGGVEHLQRALVEFVNRLPEHGVLIGCWDVLAVREVMEQARCRRISYGLGEGADYRATHVEQRGLRTSFVFHAPPPCLSFLPLSGARGKLQGTSKKSMNLLFDAFSMDSRRSLSSRPGPLESTELCENFSGKGKRESTKGTQSPRVYVRLAGRHNVCNALAAIAVADIAGIPFDRVRRALAEFPGVARRLSVMGEANGVTVIDDYAHHPTEVRATLQAVRGAFPQQRVIALFQPHRHSRTKILLNDFAACFDNADIVLITDTDGAGETPQDVSAADVAAALQRQGHPHARYVGDMQALQRQALDLARTGDVLLTLGAGHSVPLLAQALRNAQPVGQKQKCSVAASTRIHED